MGVDNMSLEDSTDKDLAYFCSMLAEPFGELTWGYVCTRAAF